MENGTHGDSIENPVETLADGFEDATEEIQNRLSAVWEASREKVTACAKAADRAVREKPYQAMGIALGVGVLIGILTNRGRGGRWD